MQALRLIFAVGVAASGVGPAPATDLRVFAAASLADALTEIAPQFNQASGHQLRLNFGGSGLLARQIREGAPVDVFLSADQVRVDQLEQAGLVLAGTRRVLLSNQLVLVGPERGDGALTGFDRLADSAVRRVAIGEPATVPVGAYALAYLEKLGLWSVVAPKVVPCENVRAVLAAVASGNVDAGIVYRTDASLEPRVRVVALVPVEDGPAIVYPAVVLATAAHAEAARALLDFLAGDAAQTVFFRHGFLPAPPDAP